MLILFMIVVMMPTILMIAFMVAAGSIKEVGEFEYRYYDFNGEPQIDYDKLRKKIERDLIDRELYGD